MSKSPSLRRIQADIRELALNPSDQYYAAPLENDMFEWHFTIRGAEGTDFEGGIYHGRILLPPEYPYKPPHIIFMTPSGRFETNTKICLSFSAFHPELWQPAWGIRLILEALISFLPTPADGALGAIDCKPAERRRLAKQSQSFVCPICGPIAKLLPKLDPDRKKSANTNGSSSAFSKEIAELQRLQQEREGIKHKDKITTKDEKTEEANVVMATDVDKQTEPKEDTRNIESKQQVQKDTHKVSSSEPRDHHVAQSTGEVSNEISTPNDSHAGDADGNGSATDTAAVPEDTGNFPIVAENSEESGSDDVADDYSKLYDPLLNVSILLMLIICVLLWRKGMELTRELNELRAIPIVDTLADKATLSIKTVTGQNEL